jgi:AcrR family transcriptional regulator
MARSTAVETKEALLAAVIRLLDRHSVADVSVKAIAAEAGVNHGLVHRYFGSKDGLVREAMQRTNARIYAALQPGSRSELCHALLQANPEVARIVARCCLDGPRDLLALAGPPAGALEAYVEPVRRALRLLGLEGQLDPYVVNAMAVSALLGWFVFRPLLDAGFGLPPDADEHGARLARLLDALIEGSGGPETGAAAGPSDSDIQSHI